MRIINASSELADFTPIPHNLPQDHLLKHHPASSLFDTITIKNGSNNGILEFKIGEAIETFGDIRAIAGCMVDLAVRAVSEKTLGSCEFSEYEMRFCAPLAAKSLKVHVNIDFVTEGCATYFCAIYGLSARKKVLLAESQGSILFNMALPKKYSQYRQ